MVDQVIYFVLEKSAIKRDKQLRLSVKQPSGNERPFDEFAKIDDHTFAFKVNLTGFEPGTADFYIDLIDPDLISTNKEPQDVLQVMPHYSVNCRCEDDKDDLIELFGEKAKKRRSHDDDSSSASKISNMDGNFSPEPLSSIESQNSPIENLISTNESQNSPKENLFSMVESQISTLDDVMSTIESPEGLPDFNDLSDWQNINLEGVINSESLETVINSESFMKHDGPRNPDRPIEIATGDGPGGIISIASGNFLSKGQPRKCREICCKSIAFVRSTADTYLKRIDYKKWLNTLVKCILIPVVLNVVYHLAAYFL